MPQNVQRSFSFNQHDDDTLEVNNNDFHVVPAASSPPLPPHYSTIPPPVPTHLHLDTRTSLNHSDSNRTVTPNEDNLGDAAVGGGISGIALGLAHQYPRHSATQETDRTGSQYYPRERGINTLGSDTPYIPDPPSLNNTMAFDNSHTVFDAPQNRDSYASPTPSSRRSNPFDDPGTIRMNVYPPRDAIADSRSYSDNPYNRYSSAWDPQVSFDPDQIDDDGDDMMNPRRRSVLPGAGPAAATSGGVLGTLGGLVGRKVTPGGGARDSSGQYGPVGQPMTQGPNVEKSEWLSGQTSGRKRLRWIVGTIIAVLIVGAIVGGVIGGLKASRSHSSVPSTPASASEDDGNGDLDKNSAEIKKLLSNPDFKQFQKIFPGVDYTPFNGQYPECLSNPLSQNNVTRDVAVLSQMTSTLRLYGTDCNQTEMVLHAADKLELTGFKVWLGVWLDGNQTTNDRGIDAMHDILSKHGADPFAGVVVGNEVLFRQELTELQLGEILSDAKEYLTSNKLDLPLATSDLGDAWTPTLAAKVDVVMANVHPFFGGVTVDKAADWTYNFWQTHNVALTQGSDKKNMVSEVGWPSAGGTHCGPQTTCTEGSTAGIDEMNEFMDTWICQSKANGTEYFW